MKVQHRSKQSAVGPLNCVFFLCLPCKAVGAIGGLARWKLAAPDLLEILPLCVARNFGNIWRPRIHLAKLRRNGCQVCHVVMSGQARYLRVYT
eukprot:scaffold650_cov407-Prasinococcus_capsulatus_cf.AAC.30